MANGENEDKKARFVENFFEDAEGKRKPRPFPGVVRIGKTFKDCGQTIVRDLRDLSEEMLFQMAAFGGQQVGQNAYGAAKTDAARIEALVDRWDAIWEDGVWASGRQEGPRVGDIFQATVEAYAEAGKPLSVEQQEALKQGLAEGTYNAKALQDDPRIKAKLVAIRAKRADERAKKLSEAAQGTSLGDLSLFASAGGDEEE